MFPVLPQLTLWVKCAFVDPAGTVSLWDNVCSRFQTFDHTHFKLGTKEEGLCIVNNVFPCSYNHLFSIRGISVIWQIWERTNSLVIPFDGCVTAINTFPTVAEREVKREWRTGTDGIHPKRKWQVLPVSSSERTIKANHVLISRPSNRLDGYPSERDQGNS